jgi:hypothetical protein
MSCSIAVMSPVNRERTSPSSFRSKNVEDCRWRCPKIRLRRFRMNRSPTQAARYSSKKATMPPTSVSPR